MNEHKTHVANYKKEEVARLESLIQKYKVIAIADMTNMPSVQLQKLRSNLKESLLITMSKARLIKIVFENLKYKIKGLEQLENNIRGMPALLLTNDNPFKLAKALRKSKSSAPAKAGQLAPNDIMVPAGPTAFPPGPIMGELGQIGIKTTVVDGKITIKEDTQVLKEGQLITGQVANILTRLGIEPMEIGINILAACENGIIFNKDVLSIDDKQYLDNLKLAALHSFNLAFNIAYPTKDNIKLLIKKAFTDSNGLADLKKILTNENIKKELSKANLEAESIKSKLNLQEEFFQEEVKKKVELVKQEVKEDKVELVKKEEKINTVKEETMTQTKKEEEVAQGVLRRLQNEKMAKANELPQREKDKDFELQEKMAKEVLKKLQDDKMKKK